MAMQFYGVGYRSSGISYVSPCVMALLGMLSNTLIPSDKWH